MTAVQQSVSMILNVTGSGYSDPFSPTAPGAGALVVSSTVLAITTGATVQVALDAMIGAMYGSAGAAGAGIGWSQVGVCAVQSGVGAVTVTVPASALGAGPTAVGGQLRFRWTTGGVAPSTTQLLLNLAAV